MIITLVKIQREKYYISTKEINLKKQEIAKGIKEELTLKVHFALVTSYKVDKILYRRGGGGGDVIYGSIPQIAISSLYL